ncbi:MAG: pilus assembly protein [Planctomycetales bacterium]|nr:pilus assembly protein [Planctomycetales bacterium]
MNWFCPTRSVGIHQPRGKFGPRRVLRRGAHTVEFALILPVLLLMVTGSIELARMHMIHNSASNAAYEGARRGALPGATASQAREAAENLLLAIGIHNPTVTVDPASIQDSTETVTVTVSVPLNDNAWLTPLFTKNKLIVQSCSLTRELVQP